MNQPDLVNGRSLPRTPEISQPPQPPAPPKVIEGKKKPDTWVKGKPQLVDHFKLHQDHVKYGPDTVEVLNLQTPKDLKRLNTLLVRAHLAKDSAGPEIVLATERVVVGTVWLCYAKWSDVFYRKLPIPNVP